jgi:hypothetical protein
MDMISRLQPGAYSRVRHARSAESRTCRRKAERNSGEIARARRASRITNAMRCKTASKLRRTQRNSQGDAAKTRRTELEIPISRRGSTRAGVR